MYPTDTNDIPHRRTSSPTALTKLDPVPEGDSIYQLSRRLQPLVGREVLHSSIRVPRFATTSLNGRTLDRIWPYGKHLFMDFSGLCVHTHLKMEGTWSIHRAGDRWRKPGHTARIVFQLQGAPTHPHPIEVVGFSLGFLRIFPTRDYPLAIKELGPDVLDPQWPEEGHPLALTNILARPTRPIGTALLDQKNLAGVGNEYRAEICFLAGIHPATPVAHTDVEQVLTITRHLMWENRNQPLRVSTGVRRAGENAYVFGRNNRPCRRCGTLITKGFLGGIDRGGDANELERVIWWCPHCQPLK